MVVTLSLSVLNKIVMFCSASVIFATNLLTRRHLPTAAGAVRPLVHGVALRPGAAALQGHRAVLNKIGRLM